MSTPDSTDDKPTGRRLLTLGLAAIGVVYGDIGHFGVRPIRLTWFGVVLPSLLHNFEHNKILHERVVILTLVTREIPYVPAEERFDTKSLGEDVSRVVEIGTQVEL